MAKKINKQKKKEAVKTAKIQKEEPPRSYSIWEKLLPPTILSIITTAFYYPYLRYPFQFDDIAHITKMFHIRHFTSWNWKLMLTPRWFANWLNKINYKMGGFDPFYYRAFNLIIHLLAGVTLFYLLFTICSKVKNSKFISKNALLISTITTALFLLHPVQSQLVSYVVQARLEGLATLFILLTLLCFVKIIQSEKLIFKGIFAILMVLFGLISVSTKEIFIVIPFLAVAIDWFLLSEQSWKIFRKRFWIYIVIGTTVFGSFIYYKGWDWIVKIFSLKSEVLNNRGNIITKHYTDMITPFAYFISQFKVIVHYFLIFLWPFNISVEYDWKLVDGFFSPDCFFPFLILCLLATFIVRNIIKKQYSFLTFGLVWFLIVIAPRSSIIPSAELICDYKTYLASVGCLFVLAIGITHIINYFSTLFQKNNVISTVNKSIIGSIALIIATYFAITGIIIWKTPINYQTFSILLLAIPAGFSYMLYYMIQHQQKSKLYSQINKSIFLLLFLLPIGYSTLSRNKVWSTNVLFWEDITKKAPLKARGHNNLGVSYAESHKWDDAIKCYKEAIRLDAHYPDPWSNLAVAYSTKQQVDMAIMALQTAIRIYPHYPEAYNNLGAFFLQKKEHDSARKCFNSAIKLRPYYGKAYMNLGRLCLAENNNDQAYENFLKATEGDLDNDIGFQALGEACVKMQKFQKAISAFRKAISLGAKHPQVFFNLANCYFMEKDYVNAQVVYEKLVQMDSNNSFYYYNLGETLFRRGNFAKALGAFNKSKTLPNAVAQVHFRIVSCLEQLGNLGDAKGYLQNILNSNPPEAFKAMALSEIKRIENLGDKSK